MDPTALALELAQDVGFDLAGVAPLRPPRDAAHFASWLAEGRHAGLAYLEANAARILDPRLGAHRGRSLLIVGLAHSRAALDLPGGGRVARYAAGRDYHNVVSKLLRKLRRRLTEAGLVTPNDLARPIVDAAPLLERSHAAEAGLGFASKAANLLHPRFGPWFFLGELVLEAELTPTGTPPPGSCGTCRACLDACPTQAIVAPGRVDAGRCISYQTIENRGPVPRALRAEVGAWAFGCDVCSEVCPWGSAAPDLAERFGTHRAVAESDLTQWIELRAPAESSAWLAGSPLQRAGRAGLARNAAIALARHPSERGAAALLRALSFDPSALVREAASWALLRAHGTASASRAAVALALARETDAAARADMRRSLEGEL